ncbi:thiamine pyrophosphate-dependent enzyme [Arenibaculum sp.]|uniref:thiamine pyrophosphate-dependent enzyme n=1 Tax=Arenibaculum sp. TaxID=2865862 RepID=UPI002E15F340|nr:thiamine pyrophosphate-dependent enzyme [Arenibaculum sp.]
MQNLSKPRLHIPVPAARPGDTPDFSRLEIPEAGSVRRPDTASDPAEMRDLAYDLIRVLDFDHRAVGPWDPRLDPETLRRALRLMVLDRAFEERMHQAQRQGKTSFFMRGLGEEAIGIAHAMALSDEDMCFTSYRQQGLLIARGCPLIDMMNQVYNNAADKLHGLQVPLHYSFPEFGYFAMSGNLATQVPQAVGWAMAAAYSGDDRIAATFLGDGATAEGDFYTGLLFASVYRAPVIISVSNNQWAISCFAGIAGGERTTFAARGVGVGLPSLRVDGNDFLAVYAAVQWAAERARSNHGATLIEFVTYRAHGHSTSDDPTRYRPADEFAAWPLGDPLQRLKGHLVALDEWSEERHQAYEQEAKDEVRALQREAEAIGTLHTGTKPSARAMFDHVFEESDWRHRRQRQEMGI